ncbi:hypothetical protein JTB14_038304 [Gonioctena quinquepunctata]|nr:hypothetical protein JTB14_038304 [Gonioctena quinquepunctata]
MSTRSERKSKGIYGKWKPENMDAAMKAVNLKQLGINEAAKSIFKSKTTLKRRLGNRNKYSSGSNYNIGRQTDLPPAVERDLVNHILQLERMFYGLTRERLMKLAYEIAEKNDIKTRFDDKKNQLVKNGTQASWNDTQT